MKKLIFAGVIVPFFAALSGHCVPASAQTLAAASSDDSVIRLQAVENENARLKRENAALREQIQLRKENSALKSIAAANPVSARNKEQEAPVAQLLPSQVHPVSVQPASINWSGFYIGAHGGDMGYSTHGTEPNNQNLAFITNHRETGLAGPHLGFQGQWGNWVVGVEGAWDGMVGNNVSTRIGDFPAGNTCNAVAPSTCNAQIKDILSAGPRVGFAMGQWMIYGTAGFAWAHIDSFFENLGTKLLPGDNLHAGWYWGGGLEVLAINAFTVGVEYKHFDFSSALHSVTGQIQDRELRAKADAVLLRVTIKQ